MERGADVLAIVLRERWSCMYLRDQVACAQVSHGIAAICARLLGPVLDWDGERKNLAKDRHVMPRGVLLMLMRSAPDRSEFIAKCAMRVRRCAWEVSINTGMGIEKIKCGTFRRALGEFVCCCGNCEYHVAKYLGYADVRFARETDSNECSALRELRGNGRFVISLTRRYVPLE